MPWLGVERRGPPPPSLPPPLLVTVVEVVLLVLVVVLLLLLQALSGRNTKAEPPCLFGPHGSPEEKDQAAETWWCAVWLVVCGQALHQHGASSSIFAARGMARSQLHDTVPASCKGTVTATAGKQAAAGVPSASPPPPGNRSASASVEIATLFPGQKQEPTDLTAAFRESLSATAFQDDHHAVRIRAFSDIDLDGLLLPHHIPCSAVRRNTGPNATNTLSIRGIGTNAWLDRDTSGIRTPRELFCARMAVRKQRCDSNNVVLFASTQGKLQHLPCPTVHNPQYSPQEFAQKNKTYCIQLLANGPSLKCSIDCVVLSLHSCASQSLQPARAASTNRKGQYYRLIIFDSVSLSLAAKEPGSSLIFTVPSQWLTVQNCNQFFRPWMRLGCFFFLGGGGPPKTGFAFGVFPTSIGGWLHEFQIYPAGRKLVLRA